MDHEIVAADRTIVDGKAGRDTAISQSMPTDSSTIAWAMSRRSSTRTISSVTPAILPCNTNAWPISSASCARSFAASEPGPWIADSHELADKFAHLLRYDGRAQRSLERWRRMWRMPVPLEALPAVPLMLFLAWHWQSLCRSLVRFGFSGAQPQARPSGNQPTCRCFLPISMRSKPSATTPTASS